MAVEIITLALRLAIVVFAGILVPAFKKWIDTKTENAKMQQIKDAASTAVAAAEQIYNIAEKSDPDGVLRRKFAKNAVKRTAFNLGIVLTDRQITEIIHAAVQELNYFVHEGVEE